LASDYNELGTVPIIVLNAVFFPFEKKELLKSQPNNSWGASYYMKMVKIN